MNRYESYKPSDIDWVGEIPSHWETVQPKYKLNRVTRSIDDEDEVITCFRDGVVTLRKNRREDGFTNSVKEHGYQQIHPGDLVVHEMDGFAGAIGISDSKGKSTPVYTVVEPDDRTDLKYISYLLREMSQTGKIESLARSIRERTTDFRWNMWSVIHFPFPPIEEQKLISRYLDKKTSQIDSLVEKIQKKIDLLKEQRTSLINHYVTKGLDSNVEMKDSGIEWIGEIPKHWEVTKYKYEITIQNGYPLKSELFDNDVGFPIIRIRDVTSGQIETYYTGEIVETHVVRNGDLLIGMDGDFNIRWWTGPESLLNQRVCRIFEEDHYNRRYLYYLLPYQLKVINDLTYYTTVKHLSSFDILGTLTILPSLSEQEAISKHLDGFTSKLDILVEKHQFKILKLKEYRQSLISSVVTGKVRVTEGMI